MNYQQLGKSTLRISKIGFGCMSLKTEFAENEKLLNKAAENGINYFDTADIYSNGENEQQVGKALRHIRKKIIIATKGGNALKPGGGLTWNPGKAYILKAAEESLRRLQTDYIDLYQLHGGTIDDPIDETIDALETLQKQGKIRYYGISSIRPNVIREYVKRSNIVSVMMQYNLLDRRPEETCLALLKENNIGVLARGSVASGLLADKPAKEYLGYSAEQVLALKNALQNVSLHERSKAESAMQFVLQQPGITAAVIGIRTLAQLNEALHSQLVPDLSFREIQSLTGVVEANLYSEHR